LSSACQLMLVNPLQQQQLLNTTFCILTQCGFAPQVHRTFSWLFAHGCLL